MEYQQIIAHSLYESSLKRSIEEAEEDKEEAEKDTKKKGKKGKTTKKVTEKKKKKVKKVKKAKKSDEEEEEDEVVVPAKKKSKGWANELVISESIYKKLSEEQIDYLNGLKVDDLKKKLRNNNCTSTGLKKEDMKRKIAYNVVNGVPEKCPVCYGGILKRADDGSKKKKKTKD